jgi:hypothetical protein
VHQGTTAQLAAKPGSLEVTQLESPRKKNSTPKPNPKPGDSQVHPTARSLSLRHPHVHTIRPSIRSKVLLLSHFGHN